MIEGESGAPAAVESTPDIYAGIETENNQSIPEPQVEETVEAPAETEESEVKKKSKNGYKQKNERLSAENAQLKAYLEQIQGKQEPAKETPKESSEPNPNDFTDVIDYLKADAAYKADQAAIKALKADKEEQAKTAKIEAEQKALVDKITTYNDKVETFKTTAPDFDAKLKQADEAGLISEELALTVMDCDDSPKVAYHLLNNPEELYALQRLTGTALTRAISKLEGRLESQGTVARVTKAAPPISPVKSQANTGTKDPSKWTQEEVEKWYYSDRKR